MTDKQLIDWIDTEITNSEMQPMHGVIEEDIAFEQDELLIRISCKIYRHRKDREK